MCLDIACKRVSSAQELNPSANLLSWKLVGVVNPVSCLKKKKIEKITSSSQKIKLSNCCTYIECSVRRYGLNHLLIDGSPTA